MAILANCTVNKFLSDTLAGDVDLKISHIRPVIKVRSDNTVVARKVWAVIALRRDWIA